MPMGISWIGMNTWSTQNHYQRFLWRGEERKRDHVLINSSTEITHTAMPSTTAPHQKSITNHNQLHFYFRYNWTTNWSVSRHWNCSNAYLSPSLGFYIEIILSLRNILISPKTSDTSSSMTIFWSERVCRGSLFFLSAHCYCLRFFFASLIRTRNSNTSGTAALVMNESKSMIIFFSFCLSFGLYVSLFSVTIFFPVSR